MYFQTDGTFAVDQRGLVTLSGMLDASVTSSYTVMVTASVSYTIGVRMLIQ